MAESSTPACPRRDFAEGETGRGPDVPYSGSHNPRAGQWDGRRLSQSTVADYKPFVMTDGEGMRCSLYVSGCPFRCVNCWNASIWDFRAGHPYTRELEDRIIGDLSRPYVQGMTFLGGEPMLNTPVLLPLARRIRAEFGHDRDIWCWTGYTWEELMRPGETPDKAELLSLTDILVDGRFIQARKDVLLQFRGSANQRVIDAPASLDQGRIVIWCRLHDLQRSVPEIYAKQRDAAEGGH
ncbi:MAG TPA: anaerobic ribonucleoside-triphosphate reductase activating protein [Pseudonocardiaceae bacterium]